MINVALRRDGRGTLLPVPLDGEEIFLLTRPGIRFKAVLPTPVDRTLCADGTIVFTSLRLVFISSIEFAAAATDAPGSRERRFVSFDVPLAAITDEAFNQPVFGANSLTGCVAAVVGGGLPRGCTAAFTFEFNEGGVGAFLPVLIKVLSEARRLARAAAPPSSRSSRAAHFSAMLSGFSGAAFSDPSDPTVIFLTQPS
jgi:hypothetical protein|tara:strand:- start:107 stop:700 length:594 start_codon:yes stop_codon:yes gene_type:complete